MSAIGTKRTWGGALRMSAFGGKADIVFVRESHKFIDLGDDAVFAAACSTRVLETSSLERVADVEATERRLLLNG
jgi:hypothetical protein